MMSSPVRNESEPVQDMRCMGFHEMYEAGDAKDRKADTLWCA